MDNCFFFLQKREKEELSQLLRESSLQVQKLQNDRQQQMNKSNALMFELRQMERHANNRSVQLQEQLNICNSEKQQTQDENEKKLGEEREIVNRLKLEKQKLLRQKKNLKDDLKSTQDSKEWNAKMAWRFYESITYTDRNRLKQAIVDFETETGVFINTADRLF